MTNGRDNTKKIIRLRFRLLYITIFATMHGLLAQDVDPSEVDLESETLVGRSEAFYQIESTSIGTKTDMDILDLPQSAQVLNRQLIEDQSARVITELYRSIAGITEYSYAGVVFRGFREEDSIFYDGLRGEPFGDFGVPQLFNIEQVEVLKGPSSSIYGGGSKPSGVINYVTKGPTFEESKKIQLMVGNYNLIGGNFESTGAATDKVAYRIAFNTEKEVSFRDNAYERNQELALGLLFSLSDQSNINFTLNYIEQNLGGHRICGVPVDYEGNFLVPISFNTAEPTDFQDLKAITLQSILNHSFSESFRLRSVFRFLNNEGFQQYHEPTVRATDRVINSMIAWEFRDQYRASDQISLTTDLIYDFQWGQSKHTVLLGGDYYDVDSEYDYFRARTADGVSSIDLYDPQYGVDISTYDLDDRDGEGVTYNRYSFYIQDEFYFAEKWISIAGVRWDNFRDIDQSDQSEFEDSHLTPRLGLLYKSSPTTSWYANYSESFNPRSIDEQ